MAQLLFNFGEPKQMFLFGANVTEEERREAIQEKLDDVRELEKSEKAKEM